MAPVPASVSPSPGAAVAVLKAAINNSHIYEPQTLIDVLTLSSQRYPSQKLSFIGSQARDSDIQTKTFGEFNASVRKLAYTMMEWNKPASSVVVVYLTEHEDNMSAVWACLLAGLVPCLQPALSAQQKHREGHVQHIQTVLKAPVWLTNEVGAQQIGAGLGISVRLFSEVKATAAEVNVPYNWSPAVPGPDDDAILFLTSGSTGFSKVVAHTHRTILAAARAKGVAYGLTHRSSILNCEYLSS